MKVYQMYVCDKCGFESRNLVDVDLCEARHMGLTLDEKHQWELLDSTAKRCTATLSTTNNETNRNLEEEAYRKLFAFEKEHHVLH